MEGSNSSCLPQASSLSIHYHNVTLCGQKVWSFLDGLADDSKPHIFGFVETHLAGVQHNKARRRAKSLGWRWLGTSASPTQSLANGNEASNASTRAYANHGGEVFLAQPQLTVTGHHQDPDAQGYRSIICRMQGFHLHLVLVYFDDGCPLDDGANAVKGKNIAALVKGIKLPWVVIGDFNKTPEELGSSSLFEWLGGIILAPEVDFTCTSNGTDRLIDFAIISPELQDFAAVAPLLDHPFKPHVVGVKLELRVQPEMDIGYVLRVPKEIPIAFGPRQCHDTWWHHWNQQQSIFPLIEAPWAQGADRAATIQYARWSRAAESYLLSVYPEGFESEEYMGRGSDITFREAAGSFNNRLDHIYATPQVSFWERLGNSLRVIVGHIKRGKENLLAGLFGLLEQQKLDIRHFWSPETKTTPSDLQQRIDHAMHIASLSEFKVCINITNAVLQKALKQFGKDSNKAYFDFCVSACSGGAGAGHSLLKVYEHDQGPSYESVEADHHKKLGFTIRQRMTQRSYDWAYSKWKVHQHNFAKDLAEVFQMLQEKCNLPEAVLPHQPIGQIRKVLASSSRNTGLGIDQWPLFLWSYLPDEALKALQLMITNILQAKIPLQALLSLVAFIGKSGGGERPIGLMAMLYRFIMRLHKGIIGEWDQELRGFWDQAVRSSSCLRAAVIRALRVEIGVSKAMSRRLSFGHGGLL